MRGAYVGTEHSQTLARLLTERGVTIYVRLLDIVVSQAGLVLVTKAESEELKQLRSKVKQLESLLGIQQ